MTRSLPRFGFLCSLLASIGLACGSELDRGGNGQPGAGSQAPPVDAAADAEPPADAAADARDGSTGARLVSSDCLLTGGAPTSVTYTAPDGGSPLARVQSRADAGAELWALVPDPWGITSASGTIKMSYSGSGAISTEVDLTAMNLTHVSAYPFIGYGGDPWGYHHGDQPPQLPMKLSAMSSLVFDTSYALAGPLPPGDILFDEWLMPSASYSGGISGTLEVEILPYYGYTGYFGTFTKTFPVPATVDGSVTTFSFDEYLASSGGRPIVLFYPSQIPGKAAGSLRFDALPLLAEAANTAGKSLDWYVAGVDLGTEFGDATSARFTFTVTKLCVEQTLRP